MNKTEYLPASESGNAITNRDSNSMYLQFWNTIRRRAAFIYIGQAVHLQRRNRKVLATNESLRDVLMPSFIWHKYEGKENLRQTYANRRLYLQSAVDVTILVTELVNFRELISTQDIQTVVLIMSDMIDYFDRKSNEYDCERLAVLPDTYVYTCGVVKSRMNHARCCVELARAMVHVNEHLTLERSHLVLLRVGIHTGKVTIMVWGGRKVHYDLISPDVFIAFHVKDSGPPGYITISDDTHTRVHMNFPTELGERLILQTECLVDGKFTVRSKELQTYYVTQEPTEMESSITSSVKSEHGLFERCVHLLGQIRASKSRKPTLLNQDFASEAFAAATTVGRRSVFCVSPKESAIPNTSIHCNGEISRWNKDRTEELDSGKPYQLDAEVLRLITQLRADPKRQITLMHIPNSSVKHHNAEWENVGVAVLYMSNLYITHWNLESAQWELSLKVLNLFVCTIDDMISTGRFTELEKVRFFNDMIVLASGLNQFTTWDCSDTTHMDILVEFCVQAQRRMQRINSEHLSKKRMIDLKIGYTRGQVTTAVIGLRKPTFVAWGRSLEVAENVARNAFAHEVQTVFECTLILSAQYEAILAGVIPVENEGLLDTYIVRPH
ncbi:adenylate/guanylate cyclase catalytic domain protein, partial [Opisthorchis viverrini]